MKSRRNRAIERILIREYVREERAFIKQMDESEDFIRVYTEQDLKPFQKAFLRNTLRNRGRIPRNARYVAGVDFGSNDLGVITEGYEKDGKFIVTKTSEIPQS